MGHQIVHPIPKTRRWEEVVALVGGAGSAQAVASAALDAAERDLLQERVDPGLLHTFWLLTQLPDAARAADFVEALGGLGIEVSSRPSGTDLVAGFAEAVDDHLRRARARTDVGEMAQLAAIETLARVAGDAERGLFAPSTDDLQRGLGRLATEKQFGELSHQFFARFSQRFLEYYVSRALPLEVGEGRRFANLGEKQAFDKALQVHCEEAAVIVRQFAGEWWSKARYEHDLSTERTERFLAYAMEKLRREFRLRAVP